MCGTGKVRTQCALVQSPEFAIWIRAKMTSIWHRFDQNDVNLINIWSKWREIDIVLTICSSWVRTAVFSSAGANRKRKLYIASIFSPFLLSYFHFHAVLMINGFSNKFTCLEAKFLIGCRVTTCTNHKQPGTVWTLCACAAAPRTHWSFLFSLPRYHSNAVSRRKRSVSWVLVFSNLRLFLT